VVVFLTSSTGRLIVGGILLFVVVVVAGAFLFFSLLNSSAPSTAPAPGPVVPAPAASSAEATRPPDLPLDETFTFRNVFAPSVKAPVAVTVSTSSSSSESAGSGESSVTNVPANTLVLESIVTESGRKVASLFWNGTTYKLHNGDRVDDSPWQVVTIYSDSVLMLFGDSRVTLTVGQGFSK
jgi:hypothetical protein